MIRHKTRLRFRLRRVGLAARASIGALLASVAVAVAAVAAPTPASAAAGTYEQIGHGYYGIIQGYSNGVQMCMDNRADLNLTNYNPVQEYQCNGSSAQNWYYEYDNSIYMEVYSDTSVMCLTAGGAAPGSLVYILDCPVGGSDAAQQWIAQEGGALRNVASGLCLDDPRFATDGHTQLQIWPCNGGANQNWLGDGPSPTL